MAETFESFHQPFRTNGMHFSQTSSESKKEEDVHHLEERQRRMPTTGVVAEKVLNALESLKRRRASLMLVDSGSDDEGEEGEEGAEGEEGEERKESERQQRQGKSRGKGEGKKQKKKKVQQWSGTTRRATMFRTTGEELPLRLQKKEHHHRADNDGKFVRTSVDACDRPSYVVERLGPRLFLKMHRNGKCEVLTSPNSKKPVCLDYVSSGETRWAFENIHRR
jgi:hypothetical protein